MKLRFQVVTEHKTLHSKLFSGENIAFKDRIEVHRFNPFPVSDNHDERGGANSANASKTTREPQNKAQATSEICRILLLM